MDVINQWGIAVLVLLSIIVAFTGITALCMIVVWAKLK